MTDMRDWQGTVGKAWAETWKKTDRSFTGLTNQFVEMIESLPGRKILDIGCGAGELSLALARRRHDAQVIGIDVSPDLVLAARGRALGHPSATFELGDASRWGKDGFAPDLLVSRHGVMFFDGPLAAFSHLLDIAAPSARLAFTCFRWPQENTWMTGLAAMIPGGAPRPDLSALGPFAFADPERINGILSSAGWSGIRIEPIDFAYIAGAGENPVADALDFFRRIGPLAATLREVEGERAEVMQDKLEGWLRRNLHDGLVAFPAGAWQVTARKG